MSKRRKVSKVKTPRARRRRRNPDATGADLVTASKSNPPLFRDLLEFALPGFGGYAGTRLLSRITYVQLSKKWPKAGKHLAVGSSIASFLAAWFLLHRVKRLEKYHTPATVGAAIAAAQTIVQAYLPKFGWMVSDFQELPAGKVQQQIAPIDDDLDDDDDDDPMPADISTLGTLGSLANSTIGRAPASAFARAAQPPQTNAAVLPIDDDLGDDGLYDDLN